MGSGYGRSVVLGGGVCVRLARRVTMEALALHRGPEYADQTVTGRSRGVCWSMLRGALSGLSLNSWAAMLFT